MKWFDSNSDTNKLFIDRSRGRAYNGGSIRNSFIFKFWTKFDVFVTELMPQYVTESAPDTNPVIYTTTTCTACSACTGPYSHARRPYSHVRRPWRCDDVTYHTFTRYITPSITHINVLLWVSKSLGQRSDHAKNHACRGSVDQSVSRPEQGQYMANTGPVQRQYRADTTPIQGRYNVSRQVLGKVIFRLTLRLIT